MAYADFVQSLSPAAYFPGNDASGVPKDISGNSRHATGTSALGYRGTGLLPTAPPFADDKSLVLSNSYVQTQKVIAPGTSKVFSMDFWFSCDDLVWGNAWVLFSIGNSSTGQELMAYIYGPPGGAGGLGMQIKAPGSTGVGVLNTTGGVIDTVGRAYHGTMVSTDAGMSIYLDGVQVASDVYSGAVGSYDTSMYWGFAVDTYWVRQRGRLGHVALWNRSLSQDEVKSLHREAYRGGVSY